MYGPALKTRSESAGLQTAALFARRSGLPVHVIVPRKPGIVSQAREVASEAGLKVQVSLSAGSVSVSYAAVLGPRV